MSVLWIAMVGGIMYLVLGDGIFAYSFAGGVVG